MVSVQDYLLLLKVTLVTILTLSTKKQGQNFIELSYHIQVDIRVYAI